MRRTSLHRHKRGKPDEDLREDVSTFIRELNKEKESDTDDNGAGKSSRKKGKKNHGEKHLPGANLGKIGVAKSRRKRIKMIMTRKRSSIADPNAGTGILRKISESKDSDESGEKRDAIVPEYEFDDNHDNVLSDMLGGKYS